MSLWLIFLAGGLLTFATRLSFIWLIGQRKAPEWLQRALRFVPPAVLAALVFPDVLMHEGGLNIALDNTRMIAGCIAILVAWRTRNAVLTILVGMVALWILQAVI